MNYDYLIEIINVIILLILLLWLMLDDISLFRKQKLIRCIFLTLIVTAAEFGCILTDNTVPANRAWSILFNCVGFGMTPLVLILESELYIENEKKYLWHYIPALVNGIFVLMSPLGGYIFRVTAANEYLRGPYFEVYLAAFLFSIVYSAVRKFLLVRTLPSVLFVKILASNAAVLSGTIYQVLNPQFHITWLGMAIYFSFVYSFLKEMDGLLDHLTGLLNQNTFHRITEQEVRAEKKVRKSAVIIFDLDQFKQINDTWGHQHGDRCLWQAAKILKQTFGSYHQIFRIGGDEFAVILSCVSEKEVCQYLEKLDHLTEKKRQGDTVFPTFSYGYALGHKGYSMEQLIKLADTRMYECKKQKKGC